MWGTLSSAACVVLLLVLSHDSIRQAPHPKRPPPKPPASSHEYVKCLVPGDSFLVDEFVKDWAHESHIVSTNTTANITNITTFVSKSRRLRKTVTEDTITVVNGLDSDADPAQLLGTQRVPLYVLRVVACLYINAGLLAACSWPLMACVVC